jgi:hypothetical protein
VRITSGFAGGEFTKTRYIFCMYRYIFTSTGGRRRICFSYDQKHTKNYRDDLKILQTFRTGMEKIRKIWIYEVKGFW